MSKVLTTEELNSVARWLYESTFYESFWGFVNWSSKMKGIAGNCNSNGQIVLNKNYYLVYGEEDIIQILKHELAHLYCFKKIGTHTDESVDFKYALEQLGGVIRAKKVPSELFVYQCPNCGLRWFFPVKLTTRHFCKQCSKNESVDIKFVEKREL